MEWDQITDSWAAMTNRLRRNMTADRQDTGRLKPGIGTPEGTAAEAKGQMTDQLISNDRNQPSRQ